MAIEVTPVLRWRHQAIGRSSHDLHQCCSESVSTDVDMVINHRRRCVCSIALASHISFAPLRFRLLPWMCASDIDRRRLCDALKLGWILSDPGAYRTVWSWECTSGKPWRRLGSPSAS